MIFLIESSKTPIYHRIAIAFCTALRKLGHTVHFCDPKEFDDDTFKKVINSIKIDYYLSTNVSNKIHNYNEDTKRFNFEEINHEMIFIHHDSAFCPPNSILNINKKLNSLIYHQDKISHFFIENNNITQFNQLGIKNCHQLNHASEFLPQSSLGEFKDQVSFVGHLMSGLREYPITENELGHDLLKIVWNRYSKSTFEIQPEINRLCMDPYVLKKINAPICHPLSIHRYFMQLTTQLSMAYRGELISKIKNHAIDIYGGDLSYGTIDNPLMKINRDNIKYHPATSNYSDTNMIYAKSKISLNLSSLQFDSAINNRIIDIILSGGFVLTDRRSNLYKESNYANEISFDTPEEMQHLLDFYLHKSNEKKYEELKMQVYEEFKEKFSYENTCSKIINELNDK